MGLLGLGRGISIACHLLFSNRTYYITCFSTTRQTLRMLLFKILYLDSKDTFFPLEHKQEGNLHEFRYLILYKSLPKSLPSALRDSTLVLRWWSWVNPLERSTPMALQMTSCSNNAINVVSYLRTPGSFSLGLTQSCIYQCNCKSWKHWSCLLGGFPSC